MRKSIIVVALSLVALWAVSGQIFELPEKGDWQNTPELTEKAPDNLVFTGKGELHATDYFKINPLKDTVVSLEARKCVSEEQRVRMLVGFWLWDQENRQIHPRNVAVVTDSMTTLLIPCKKDSKSIMVENASAMKPGMVVAFEAKEDLSDLPNFYTSHAVIEKIEQQEKGDIIIFKEAINQEFPDRTIVRAHNAWGGYFYAIITALTTDFKSYSKTIPSLSSGKADSWWPGAVTAEAVLFLLDKEMMEFKNFKIETINSGVKK